MPRWRKTIGRTQKERATACCFCILPTAKGLWMSLRARVRKLERRPRRGRIEPELLADVVRLYEGAGSRPLRPDQAGGAPGGGGRVEGRGGGGVAGRRAGQMGEDHAS